MKNRSRTEILYFVYAFMLLLSILFSIASKSDITSIVINFVLFGLVELIFFYSQKLLKNVIKITND